MCLCCKTTSKISAPKSVKDKKIFKAILAFGIHFRDCKGWTPLHHAIQLNLPKFVEELLQNGADTKARTNVAFKWNARDMAPGLTCLQLAVKLNRLEIVKSILKANDLKGIKTDFCTYDILYTLMIKENIEMVKILLDHNLVDVNNSELTSIMYHAIDEYCSDKWVKLILDHGFEVDKEIGSHGRTGLILALMWNPYNEIVRLFLEYGANPNHVMKYSWCKDYVLTWTLNIRNFEGAKLLLQSGASISPRNKFGNTIFEEVLKNYSSIGVDETWNQIKQIVFFQSL